MHSHRARLRLVRSRRDAVFEDRVDAGRQLAGKLSLLRGQDVVVLGVPRGGIPVASEVAEALDAALDVVVVRKLGLPAEPELAMGAVGEDGARVLNRDVLEVNGVSDERLEKVERQERQLLLARVARLRQGRPRVDVHGRTVIIVDDGFATGASAAVACQVARQLGAARVVLAAPVAPPLTVRRLAAGVADDVVCVCVRDDFRSVGLFYRDFTATTEEDVVTLLAADRRSP